MRVPSKPLHHYLFHVVYAPIWTTVSGVYWNTEQRLY